MADHAHARGINRIVPARGVAEGVNTMVQRSIGGEDLPILDPFLTLDEFRMSDPSTTKGKGNRNTSSKLGTETGFPDHPHRGFETVTLMLKGHFQHEDFAGHKGRIGPGDVQWMTAGRGIVHAEMPLFLDQDDIDIGIGMQVQEQELTKKTRAKKDSRDIWGLQLWVNLPKEHKLCKPQYQELKDAWIPRWSGPSDTRDGRDDGVAHQSVEVLKGDTNDSSFDSNLPTRSSKTGVNSVSTDIEVKVIAGESHGVKSKVYTRTPTQYFEIKMKSNQELIEWIPETHEGFIYILQGRGYFGMDMVEGQAQQLLILSSVDRSNETSHRPKKEENLVHTQDNLPLSSTLVSKFGHDISKETISVPDSQQQSEQFNTTATASIVNPQRSFIQITTRDQSLHMVLITGEPCREPVFRQGPFVMTSQEELDRTFRDYEEKKRGFERAKGWVSSISQGTLVSDFPNGSTAENKEGHLKSKNKQASNKKKLRQT
ncbi:hypothetical protein BX616_008988 [Lobosporangium transversale]|uniref:RmlC-like cupin domain-containing protein n=1 Tax=Lobosporangium transversale TaxID=64571 RepID=A0A1Y2GEU8_9FUNG|nr:RmlC-like cupin domain-containing protein [Lobosporangium transversale]KAF9914093.1 hypothetical protein BX616_008988 [Lobosporangium transversale]ORZ07522.1 RmlC-like cupin domain-containing protein [Lobosporangium transversale]|eukprot:XP_021878029.1 RmlC-like cupin domain-containing protein [Lobosporangium transversale]